MEVKEASFHFKNTLSWDVFPIVGWGSISWECPSKRRVSSTEFEVGLDEQGYPSQLIP